MVFVLDSIRVQFCIWFNWFQKSVCVLKSCSDNLRTQSILRTVPLTLFLAFDEDGDGFLNLEQVYQAIHSLGKVWPMKDIREALPKDCKEVDFPGKIIYPHRINLPLTAPPVALIFPVLIHIFATGSALRADLFYGDGLFLNSSSNPWSRTSIINNCGWYYWLNTELQSSYPHIEKRKQC